MTLAAQMNFSVALQEYGASAVFGSAPAWAGQMGLSMALAAGVAAGDFDLGYFAERTVADGATDNIDLSGALTSPLGTAFVGIKLVMLGIINKPRNGVPNTTALTIGAGSNKIVGLFDSLVLPPGGFLLTGADALAGIAAITAATADILKVLNGAGAGATYQIAALGRSA